MSYEIAIDRFAQIYRKVDLETILDRWARNENTLNVYVHSPFCPSICRFCYYKGVQFSFERDSALYDRFYSDYLPRSVKPFTQLLQTKAVANYFFGGGTPSLMRPETMRSVFGLFPGLRDVPSKTFEIHPAVWTQEQVDVLAEHAFNCCIIGIQSFEQQVLERQRRIHAPFEKIFELANAIRRKGMFLAADLIYRMDDVDADAIFERDLALVARLHCDVISLQLNYDTVASEQSTEKFFELILSSKLAEDYRWECADFQSLSVNLKKTMKCLRLVRNDIALPAYRTQIFPFVHSLDEASKVVDYSEDYPSVIGFGSYRNPRKNTFSILRDGRSTLEYVEINNDWQPEYYITFESESPDFFDDCIDELNRIREIGPLPRGMRIVLENKASTAKENYIYRRTNSPVNVSVAWDYATPQVKSYVEKLKSVFPHWNWWGDS